jgi:hypothetical protein
MWEWSRIVELAGLVVTILSLHFSNVRAQQRIQAENARIAQQTRDELTRKLTQMETKLALIYSWFKVNVFKGRVTESDDEN